MRPRIDSTKFGSIAMDGSDIEHDVLIRLSGEIKKRKKKLSKAVFGTSHIISLEEAEQIFEKGADRLIIGSGQDGNVRLLKRRPSILRKRMSRLISRSPPMPSNSGTRLKAQPSDFFMLLADLWQSNINDRLTFMLSLA